MNKTKKWAGILLTLLCAFILSLSLGVFCACNAGEKTAETAKSGTWYYGATVPQGDLGKEGDYYLNTSNLASYVKDGETWRVAADGEVCSWYYGDKTPQEAIGDAGNAGDFYLNTKTGELYQKGADSWGSSLLTLKGTPGRDGVMWFSGKLDPAETPKDPSIEDAVKGDFYMNTDDFSVWQLQEDGTWEPLGTLKGDPGADAKQPVRFFNGDGAPTEGNPKDPQEGDLYLGVFGGLEEGSTGKGSRLYRYLDGDWVVLMESMKETLVEIRSYAELVTFANKVNGGKDYAGVEVHLKTDIDFNRVEGVSLYRAAVRAVTDWTPIGTSDRPFRGTFDGEGNTIENFNTAVSTDPTKVGFFGNLDGATIQNLHFANAVVDATEAEIGSLGSVVVGQAQGKITVKNVTVDATVKTDPEEENNATVGGLVGKLEGEEGTALNVSGSTVSGKGASDLVAEKGEANVTVTDSSVTDGDNTTAWDKGGNHYAEDENGVRSYFVGSAEDITALFSKAEEGAPVNVTLESDLTLDGSTPFAVNADLTIDVGGNNLTVKSQGTSAGISVEAGKNLTIKGTGAENEVQLDSASSKPAISVKGSGATLDIQGANVSVKNTNSGKPAILAENGGVVNLNDNTIGVEGTPSNTSYMEPQVANVTGKGSVLNIEDTTVNSKNATAFYVEKQGTLNFKSGEINFTGGDFCAAIGFGDGAGKVVFSGGTINIKGDLTGVRSGVASGFQDIALAIGGTTDGSQSDGQLIINGGTINLENTSGTAIAIGGMADNYCYAYVGDKAVINTHATGSGKAYVSVTGSGFPTWLCYIYGDTEINGVDDLNNFKMLNVLEKLANGYLTYGGVSFETDNLPEEYTRKAMGLE